MNNPKGLVILHVDGLSYGNLHRAIAAGRMPFVEQLLNAEGYEAQPYRCGIPSTTPFAQAGILYGDNCEIPSFRWWDKESGRLIEFGAHSSFRHVAHKYFKHSDPLTRGGACIAACYPAGAVDNMGIAYQSLDDSRTQPHQLARRVISSCFLNPLNLIDWSVHGFYQIWKAELDYSRARLAGKSAARMYVLSDLANEIFLHQLTRLAVIDAMEEDYPTMYAGFYAYDETAHAYGPSSDYSLHILRHIDHTIRRIAEKRLAQNRKKGARDYELVILSDHGSIETIPFHQRHGKHFGNWLAEWLPNFEVTEHHGKRIKPKGAIDGHIDLAYSGGLAHLYFRESAGRMNACQIEVRFPGLVEKIAKTPGIGFVLLKEGTSNLIVTADRRMNFGETVCLKEGACGFLAQFDNPFILARQLQRLNSFERSGDMILFGGFVGGEQINFENQVGGHGSVGGEQLHPFILTKREWNIDTSNVTGAHELYPLLQGIRDRLLRLDTIFRGDDRVEGMDFAGPLN